MHPHKSGAEPAVKLHGGDPPEPQADKSHKNWAHYAKEYGQRHDAVIIALAKNPDGLTGTEVGTAIGIKRTSQAYLTELERLGLVRFDTVRSISGPNNSRRHSPVAVLTELGVEKARWLASDPFPVGSKAPPPANKKEGA